MMMLVVKARYELAPTSMLMRMWPSSPPYAFKKENFGYIWHLFPRSVLFYEKKTRGRFWV